MDNSTGYSEQIYNHVEKHVGTINNVYKEIIPDHITVDILVVDPTPKRNYYTLITSGMSASPMTVPEGAEEYRHAEVMICLPPTWKLSDEAFKDERNYWPIRALKVIAKFPHEYNTWLYLGHTVANGNPVQAYSDDAFFQGMLLWLPEVEDKVGFFNLNISDEKVVHFYNLFPLYAEEMDYKLKNSEEALLNKFIKAGVSEVVDISRKNSCKKKWGLF
ncbi:suppressor of fused domain protein [Paenibacillus sp. FSL K6-2524]|uniref:suppressor of fused domain protein n=1 Tax=Paenibacillus sp. FSL K6-2524 TaxID=2954516 RepID=UPI0030F4FD1B